MTSRTGDFATAAGGTSVRWQFILLSLLIALAAIPLVLLRGDPDHWAVPIVLGSVAVVLGLWGSWSLIRRRGSRHAMNIADAPEPLLPTPWMRQLLTFGLLALLAWLAFYQPMQRSYWRGEDDFGLLWVGDDHPVWSRHFDQFAGRPMQMFVVPALARAIAPGRMDGYLWLAGAIWFACGWMLYLIVGRLFPGRNFLAVAAAALMLVSPTEPSRFFAFSTGISYLTSLLVLLASFWCLLVSVDRRHPGWLVAACFLLGATLLSNEGQFPLALMGFVLIWANSRDRANARVAAYAWFSTLLLLSVRFIMFLMTMGRQSYQLRQASSSELRGIDLLKHLGMQFGEVFEYLDIRIAAYGQHLYVVAITVALTSILVWKQRDAAPVLCERRKYRLGLLLGCGAIVLGVLPFLHMGAVFRTQFFAIPGQAVVVALALGLFCSRIPARYTRRVEVIGLMFLVLNSTISAQRLQDQRIDSPAFERSTHIYQQLHGIAPEMSEDQVVVIITDDRHTHSIGSNYCLNRVAHLVLGTGCVQANYEEPSGDFVHFTSDGVAVTGATADFLRKTIRPGQEDGPCIYPYDKVIAFRSSADGNLQLLDELPAEHLDPGVDASAYNPQRIMSAAIPEQIDFFRYESAGFIPADVIPHGQGLMLDSDWGPLCCEGDFVSRNGGTDASILINPMGQQERLLTLNVAPVSGLEDQAVDFTVVDQDGRKVEAFILQGRQQIQLRIPLRPDQINRISFIPEVSEHRTTNGRRWLRLICPAEHLDQLQRQLLLDSDAVSARDIHDRSIRIGRNWHGLTTGFGPQFRWVDTNAELIVPQTEANQGVIRIDLESGPSYGSGPLELNLCDYQGNVIATTSVNERDVVEFPLSNLLQRSTILRLVAEGQRLPIPGDSRVLNFRVFNVQFEALNDEEFDHFLAMREPVRRGLDIPSDDLLLGENWGPPEVFEGQLFRWVDTSAEVVVPTQAGVLSELVVDAEPGPSCGRLPATAYLIDDLGHTVAVGSFSGRTPLRFPLPRGDGKNTRYRICLDGDRVLLPSDPRVLNFRVFGLQLAAPIAGDRLTGAPNRLTAQRLGDIPLESLTLGGNWGPMETLGGLTFRWIDTSAEVVISAIEGRSGELVIDAEPGPSSGRLPARLYLLNCHNQEIASVSFSGRETLHLPLPTHAVNETVYRLCLDGEGIPVPNDPRKLNFRVFGAAYRELSSPDDVTSEPTGSQRAAATDRPPSPALLR